MRVVADKLAEWTLIERNETDADAFGRSAFNRYYYASYLITREMLNDLDTGWTRTPHASIPELLQKTIVAKIRKELKQKQRSGLLTTADAVRFRVSANNAISELSNILKIAYSIRVIADYEPETKIIRSGRNIELADETLQGAKNWTRRVLRYTKSILNVWRQLGIT